VGEKNAVVSHGRTAISVVLGDAGKERAYVEGRVGIYECRR
jgi:hypothetical protein